MSNPSSRADASVPISWSRYRYPDTFLRYGAWLCVFVFLVYCVEYLNIPLDRLLGIFGRMGDILANRYYPPDID